MGELSESGEAHEHRMERVRLREHMGPPCTARDCCGTARSPSRRSPLAPPCPPLSTPHNTSTPAHFPCSSLAYFLLSHHNWDRTLISIKIAHSSRSFKLILLDYSTHDTHSPKWHTNSANLMFGPLASSVTNIDNSSYF